MEYKEVYESWLANPYFDEATKQELLSIKDDENEIKERFYADLEFGTAGLRGVIGAGTNRMNVYVVRKTTQGLANYIIKQNAADKGVAIAFDSRRMSTEFANEAALCLAANGIKAYIFDALRPTPELSFAVREPYPSINSGAESDILAVQPASISQPATIHRNTTVTRFTGQMARRLHRRMIQGLWRK